MQQLELANQSRINNSSGGGGSSSAENEDNPHYNRLKTGYNMDSNLNSKLQDFT